MGAKSSPCNNAVVSSVPGYLLILLFCSVPVISYMQFNFIFSGFPKEKLDTFNKNLMVDDFGSRVEPVYQLKDLHRFKSEPRNLLNPYVDGFSFDFYVYVSESEKSFKSESELVWAEKSLNYGSDSLDRKLRTVIPISKNVQNNGSLYLHLYLVRSGLQVSSCRNETQTENCYFNCAFETNTIHRVKRLNLYKRKRPDGDHFSAHFGDHFSDELHSHWHPNLTICLVRNTNSNNDLQEPVNLVDTYPIFFNDQLNFLSDYQPINRTTELLPLRLTFSTLNLAKYIDYSRETNRQFAGVKVMKFVWFGWFNKRLVQTEQDQDFVRKKLIDSNFDLTNSSAFLVGAIVFFFGSVGELSIGLKFIYIIFAALLPEKRHGLLRLKAVSVRCVYYELVQSLAVLNITFFLCAKLYLALKWKRKSVVIEYDPETNRHDVMATRFFSIFFLPLLVGYFVYSYHYDPYESFLYHIPMVFYDFFWYFGSIFWIPQLYINYKLRLLHQSVRILIILKSVYFIAQIICILFFLYTGLFWLVAKHYPVSIVGHLIFDLVQLSLIYQSIKYNLLDVEESSTSSFPGSTKHDNAATLRLEFGLEYESRRI